MKTPTLASPAKRLTIAIALILGALLALAALSSIFNPHVSNAVNGPKIIAAAQNYTREMRTRRLPIPASVPLTELVAHGYLQAADIGPFQGLDATVSLLAQNSGAQTVLMRVPLPDGTDILLLADGSMRQIKRN